MGVPADIASRLNARRRELGLSVGELASRLGVSRSNVEALMSGKRSPAPGVAEALIRALELDEGFAAELRSLDESQYRSGFASGPIRLTKERDSD
jgi:transcriptional regulator with XRE-family HTH domain